MTWEEDTLKKIHRVCDGCKFFDISTDGQCEYFRCMNDNRLYELYGDEYDEYEDAGIIATAYYSSNGKLLHVELEDYEYNLNKCEYKKREEDDQSKT